MLSIRNVSKTFTSRDGSSVVALNNISLEIKEGEFIVAVGPSGCGKSTLLKMIAGLLPFEEGEIAFEDSIVNKPRLDVGLMFQTSVLLPWRTVMQNLLLPVEVQKKKRTDYLDKIEALLRKVDLLNFKDKFPWELSGGMQQRVALCRTLLMEPKLMLMDEPFGALDEFTREKLNLEVLNLWSEARQTVFLVTHSINEAVYLADRIVVMSPRPGEIVEVINIDLPRPRGLEIIGSPEFSQHVYQVRERLGGQIYRDDLS